MHSQATPAQYVTSPCICISRRDLRVLVMFVSRMLAVL